MTSEFYRALQVQSFRQRSGHIEYLYRAPQFEPPEWPAYDATDGLLEIWRRG